MICGLRILDFTIKIIVTAVALAFLLTMVYIGYEGKKTGIGKIHEIGLCLLFAFVYTMMAIVFGGILKLAILGLTMVLTGNLSDDDKSGGRNGGEGNMV